LSKASRVSSSSSIKLILIKVGDVPGNKFIKTTQDDDEDEQAHSRVPVAETVHHHIQCIISHDVPHNPLYI
jgi:hypothetical protein